MQLPTPALVKKLKIYVLMRVSTSISHRIATSVASSIPPTYWHSSDGLTIFYSLTSKLTRLAIILLLGSILLGRIAGQSFDEEPTLIFSKDISGSDGNKTSSPRLIARRTPYLCP